MRMRDIEFGHVFNASGARGFQGEGYWFHHLARPFGLSYKGSTLVTKTTTLAPRPGNMPLEPDHKPREMLPRCIVVKPMAGVVLNAVGLSGPGIHALVQRWQASDMASSSKRAPRHPFIVSIMSVAPDAPDRLHEIQEMIGALRPLAQTIGANLGLQVNLSCPNAGLDTRHLCEEANFILDETAKLGIATMVKLNALVPQLAAAAIAAHPACDAIVVSNTIPWGELRQHIDWQGLFGSKDSPLAKLGGGGLSGKPLLGIVRDWAKNLRTFPPGKRLVLGGGVLCKTDADELITVGADAIELGSVAILRPWRVRGIIRHCNNRYTRMGGGRLQRPGETRS